MALPKLSSLRPQGSRRPADADDRALVRRTLGGEKGAFGQLYERHADRVFRYLLFRTRDADLAHDLAQDVFLSALKGLPGLQHPERFEGWLLRIAHNRLVNHWARRANRPDVQSLDATADEDTGRTSPSRFIPEPAAEDAGQSRVDTRLQVQALLAGRLNPTQREVLALRFAAGLSLRETAEIVGCTESAARQHQYRALLAIRRGIKAEAGAEQADQDHSR